MEIVLRAVVIYAFLWMLTRAIGKKEIAEMSAFELVLIVTIDLVQQGVTQEDMSVTGAMLAVGTITLLVVATSYAGFRWRGSKKAIEGVPIVVVDDGSLVDESLVMGTADARRGGVVGPRAGHRRSRPGAVRVLEPDGTFSFIQRDPGVRHVRAPEKPS
ncbi:MAG: DUF421 domain-containing protein [Actinomycetota bacterium]